MMQKVENRPHRYRDSFDNGCCERLECGRDRDDPIHHRHAHLDGVCPDDVNTPGRFKGMLDVSAPEARKEQR